MDKFDVFHNLAIICKADGKLTRGEIEGLKKAALDLGVHGQDALLVLTDVIADERSDFIVPQDIAEKRDMLARLVWLSLADDDLDAAEYDQLVRFATLAGLEAGALDKLIREHDYGF